MAEQAALQQRRNSLHRRIDNWRSVQNMYMPYAAAQQVQNELKGSSSTDNDNDLYWFVSDSESEPGSEEDADEYHPGDEDASADADVRGLGQRLKLHKALNGTL